MQKRSMRIIYPELGHDTAIDTCKTREIQCVQEQFEGIKQPHPRLNHLGPVYTIPDYIGA